MDDSESSEAAPDAAPARYGTPCTRPLGDSAGRCGATPTRRFTSGWYCVGHAPAYVKPPAGASVDPRSRLAPAAEGEAAPRA